MTGHGKPKSILDALLYAQPGVGGVVKRWKTLAGLSSIDRQRVKYIAQLIDSPSPRTDDIKKAAGLLRMLGYTGDAIRLLRKHRLIEDAAEILTVSGNPIAAAKLFEKNRMWKQAAHSYELANSRTCAARCHEADGCYLAAATMYESQKDFANAARCYENSGTASAAALCYANDKDYKNAIRMFEEWHTQDPDEFSAMPIGYVDALVMSMARGRMNQSYINLVERRGSMPDLVRELLKAGRETEATRLYKKYREDIVDDLCKWAETDTKDGYRALKLFESTGDMKAHRYVNTHFSVADSTKQKLSYVTTRTSQRDPEQVLAAQSRPAVKPKTKPKSIPVPVAKTIEEFRIGGATKERLPAIVMDPPTDKNTRTFNESDFFKDFDEGYQSQLWDKGRVQKFLTGTIIVDFKSKPPGTITVLEGSVTLYKRVNGKIKRVGSFTAGQSIGESWLLYEMASEVRVIAATNCVLHIAQRVTHSEQSTQLSQLIAARLARHLIERVKPGTLSN